MKVDGGYVGVDEWQRTSVPHIYAAGDVTGQMPLSSVAAMQGRKIARHALGQEVTPLDYGKVAQAIFTDPEIASVGLEEVDAAALGRKVRITKVPFAANPRALIQASPRGFVKVVSDPATRVVLGGTVVGRYASELIAPIALASQARLRVDQLVETLMVHPSMSREHRRSRRVADAATAAGRQTSTGESSHVHGQVTSPSPRSSPSALPDRVLDRHDVQLVLGEQRRGPRRCFPIRAVTGIMPQP